MAKRILTLTLIGLMAAVFFPVCANAQVQPENLAVGVDDPFDVTPTLEWTCASGPTVFKVSVNDVEEETTVDAGALTDGKWDRTGIEVSDAENEIYKYTYPLTLEVGTHTWQVVAEREDAKTLKDDGYVADAVLGADIVIFGNITLSLVADKTGAVAMDQTVIVTVSLDNSTNGDIPVDTLAFSVGYNDGIVTPATTDFATPMGRAASLTPATETLLSGADAKVTVAFTEEIAAGEKEGIVALAFTVTGSGDNTFAFVEEDIVITSTSVVPATGENPFEIEQGDPQTINVAEPVTQGDLNGDESVDLADAVIALKVLAGMTITADVSAHTAAYGAPDVALVVFILKAILAG